MSDGQKSQVPGGMETGFSSRGQGAGGVEQGQSIGSVNCFHEIPGEKNIAGPAIERIDMMHTELNSAENLCENQKTEKKLESN